MTDTEKRVKQQVTLLLLDEPFFGALALRLQVREDPTCQTAWTDGQTLGISPTFAAGLTDAELKTVIAHEVLHCANGHPWRRDARQTKRWNQATDYAINAALSTNGFTMPTCALLDSQYSGQSAEAIYSALPPEPEQPQGDGQGDDDQEQGDDQGQGQGSPDPGGMGETRDAPSPAEADDQTPSEADWQQATITAAQQAKAQGNMPAGMERAIAAIREPSCRDLLAALLEYTARTARSEYSWTRPSKRHLSSGLYLPRLQSDELPPIAACVDTSGSIDMDTLHAFVGALQTVLDRAHPASLRVIAADARVQADREYLPGDTLADGKSAFPGGGGTDFRPTFETLADAQETPACVIYLTDLMGTFPTEEPTTPTLWVVTDSYGRRHKPPFGEVIYLD